MASDQLLDEWETIEGPRPSPQSGNQEAEGLNAEKQPTLNKDHKVVDFQSSKFQASKYKMKGKHALIRQFSELQLGPSEVSVTPSASASSSIPQDAATMIKELGFSGDDISSLPRSFIIAVNNRFTRDDLARFQEDAELNFSHSLPYFFSGSFIFPSCLRAVTDGTTLLSVARSMTPATLLGHNRFAVRGQPWPAMLPSINPEDCVKGFLVFGMLDSQRRAIHRFENNMFDLRRTKAEIELKDGERVTMDTGVYVWNQEPDRLVKKEETEWRVEHLIGSSWFNGIIQRAEEEEMMLEQQSS
ncbi:hypothetical protein EJ04DRAFT_511370 [Polyplosphaeria fusca]|uniref:Gamma-glutamylcyclotransferase AIG2-like domain-containing protein n=1 Tax=Polyplosphaeria fusca TaxID=682080 RepID=A0A9P4R2Y6_9PLEO|nr:hypothetical protein EJ04DRAFT_511370 [Polyplosphaeria fusca]